MISFAGIGSMRGFEIYRKAYEGYEEKKSAFQQENRFMSVAFKSDLFQIFDQ
jgi:hypothetical protein